MSYHSGHTPKPETGYDKLKRVNVLVLDGGAKAAQLIKAIFAELGLTNVFVASDGYEGVQVMKEVKIHMIFTDWELKVRRKVPSPGNDSGNEIAPLDGLQFVQRLRRSSHSPNPFIPIIMMMDNANPVEIVKARDSGVNEVLLRPIDAERFCHRLISIIDHPRMFITADSYKGPCRRRKQAPLPPNMKERRIREIRVIKSVRS